MVVKDIYFVWTLAALAGFAAVAYAVRIAVRGVARSERVSRIGGTAILGQSVMDWTYWAVEPIVGVFVSLGITPNGVTWTALVLGSGAGVALGFGWFGLATLLATMSTIFDILDGQVARMTNTGSNKGELLDAAIDRYTEFAFLAGLAVFFHNSVPLLALTLGALLASFMVSYASAKAEALQVTPPRGLMRRHERSTYLIVGAGFSAMFGGWLTARFPDLPWYSFELLAIACVAVIGNFAAVQRLVRVGRALK
ncbi:MAG: CDP-diacylglycerol--glycerol-3-phosphate 3-phosphatidyltransferase [Myxococcales bacterium]|nr:CDP-diacylglycerol--glycerol-3-phosphate 3-phosphatidyltransferase [Myxococcales bacterium]